MGLILVPTPLGPQGLGWRPELERPARAAWSASGSPPRYTAGSFADDGPLPAAFSLAYLILYWFNQGQVGSCFANAACSAIHLAIAFAAQVLGLSLEEVQLSRAWLWYHGRKLDGLLGYASDGGSITNALRAAHEFGVSTEAGSPYQPSHGWLEKAPSADAQAAAKLFGLKGLVDLRFDDAGGIRRSIRNGCPPEIGIWWPYGWDQGSIDQFGRAVAIGRGTFGHALVVIGWADPGVWDGHLWWQILNSHGPIYPLPSEEMRAKVQGYASARPDRCYSFWVRDDLLRTVAGYGSAEIVAPVGPYAPDARSPASWESGLS